LIRLVNYATESEAEARCAISSRLYFGATLIVRLLFCKAQTPLARFVVQQVVQQIVVVQHIHNFSTSSKKSTTSLHVRMLWICYGLDNNSTTYRINRVWLSTCPQQVEKLYNNSTTLRQVLQQIHNKSNKWSLSLSRQYDCTSGCTTERKPSGCMEMKAKNELR
jgi:hypothetical protein